MVSVSAAPATPPQIGSGLKHKSTTATLSYFQPPLDGSVPYDRLYPSKTEPETNVDFLKYPTELHDLRPLVDAGRSSETNIRVTGFQVLEKEVAKTEMSEEDFNDDAIVRSKYYDEVTALYKTVTGATRVIIFDHTIRRAPVKGEAPIEDTPESRLPVSRVHIDQTPASGTARVRRHAGADAERLLKTRCQLVNLWRPLRGPVYDAPLAVADARTLQPSDLVPSRLLYAAPTPEGETFQVAHNPAHTWYYLSSMVRDEALMLQCWSNENGASLTPHSGVIDDAYVGKDVQARQSIEVRALLFFEDEAEI